MHNKKVAPDVSPVVELSPILEDRLGFELRNPSPRPAFARRHPVQGSHARARAYVRKECVRDLRHSVQTGLDAMTQRMRTRVWIDGRDSDRFLPRLEEIFSPLGYTRDQNSGGCGLSTLRQPNSGQKGANFAASR